MHARARRVAGGVVQAAERQPRAGGGRRVVGSTHSALERRLQRGAPFGAERARRGAQRRIELRQRRQPRRAEQLGEPRRRRSRHRDDDGAARLVAAEREAEAGLGGGLGERLTELPRDRARPP